MGESSTLLCARHRSTFEAPLDPKVVLGGYPTGANFHSYMGNATALLITFPLNATAAMEPMALMWEGAFLREVCTGALGHGKLYLHPWVSTNVSTMSSWSTPAREMCPRWKVLLHCTTKKLKAVLRLLTIWAIGYRQC